MRGVRRLFWSAVVLSFVGCQSLPSGSTTLFDQLGEALRPSSAEKSSAKAGGSRALISSRRSDDSTQTDPPVAEAESAEPELTLPGRWADDEVLKMVVEHEFADATAEERRQWMTRLAQSREEDVPRILAERRRELDGTAESAAAETSLAKESSASAQQIILTEHESDAGTHANDNEETSATQVAELKQHPLLDDDLPLSAPLPGGGRPPATPVETVSDENGVEDKGVLATVFDAFGVGGETRAARNSAKGTSTIKLADPNDPVAAETSKAEAIARDLERAKSLQSVYWQDDLDKLIALLETQVAQQTPGETEVGRDLYIRQHVALRMLYLIATRRSEALQAIPQVPEDQQEFWTQMFWALSTTFDEEAIPDSAVRAAETVAQLRAAIRQMQSSAALELHRSRFCQQINGFGDFETFAADRFSPGQPVLIYTEVRNFSSEATPQGEFRTLLRSKLTIREESASGPVVLSVELPEAEDRCRSPREDYFHSFRIQMPTTLKPGPHVLTLEMTDPLTGKSGTTTLHFLATR